MLTLLIFILFVITFLLLIFKYKKTGLIFLILTFSMFLMTGMGIFSSYILKKLESYPIVTEPNWKKHNAIILLGAGAEKTPEKNIVAPTLLAYSRIYETARLYLSCKKTNNECVVIISGGDALSTGTPEAVVYQNALIALGIKKTDMILESNSMNTYKNAEFTSAILKTKKVDNIFLVTSGIHMKRALLYFSYFGIHAAPSISDYIPPRIFVIPLGYNFAITDFVIHECIGIARFYIYNYFGLNINPKISGAP